MKYKRIPNKRYKCQYICNNRQHRYQQLRKIVGFADTDLIRKIMIVCFDWHSHDMGGGLLARRIGND